MKIRITYLSLIVLSVLATFSSCKEKKSASITAVSKDAQAVLVVNNKTVLKKADLANIKDYSFYSTFLTELENENKKYSEFVESTMSSPMKSGVDLLGSTFFYYLNKDEKNYTVIVLPIEKEKNYTEWVTEMLDISEAGLEIESGENCSYVDFSGNVVCAWNASASVVVYPIGSDAKSGAVEVAQGLMNLEKDNQISENKSFMDFYGKVKDISFWVDYSIFDRFSEYKQIYDKMDLDLSDAQLCGFIECLNGEVNIATEAKLPKEIDLSKYYGSGLNDKVLAYAPADLLAVMSGSINTDVIVEAIKKSGTDDSMIKAQTGFSIDEIINTFGGSIFIYVSGITNEKVEYTDMELGEENGMPSYKEVTKTKNSVLPKGAIIFDITGTKVLEKFEEMVKMMGMLTEHDGYYEYKQGSTSYFFGYNSDVLVISLSKDIMDAFAKKGFSDNFGSTDDGKKAKDNMSYFKIDFESDNYPKELLDEYLSEDQKSQLLSALSSNTVSYIETTSKDNESHTVIKLKDDSENSLKFMLKKIDEIAKKAL